MTHWKCRNKNVYISDKCYIHPSPSSVYHLKLHLKEMLSISLSFSHWTIQQVVGYHSAEWRCHVLQGPCGRCITGLNSKNQQCVDNDVLSALPVFPHALVICRLPASPLWTAHHTSHTGVMFQMPTLWQRSVCMQRPVIMSSLQLPEYDRACHVVWVTIDRISRHSQQSFTYTSRGVQKPLKFERKWEANRK